MPVGRNAPAGTASTRGECAKGSDSATAPPAPTSRRVDASHTSGRGPTARSDSVASDHPSVVATFRAIVAGSAAKT